MDDDGDNVGDNDDDSDDVVLYRSHHLLHDPNRISVTIIISFIIIIIIVVIVYTQCLCSTFKCPETHPVSPVPYTLSYHRPIPLLTALINVSESGVLFPHPSLLPHRRELPARYAVSRR